MPDIRVDQILPLTVPLKGDATTIVVQDLETRKVTMQELSSIIANSVPSDTPVGQVSFFATTVAPNGWIECKGSKLNIVGEYNELYKAIGHTFTDILNPLVDKSKYFYAPDLRGYFIRGLDNGANVDEDTTRKLGSIQEDSIEKHRHDIVDNGGDNDADGFMDIGGEGNVSTGKVAYTQYTGGLETRPKNVALLPCIKYSAAKGPATPVTPGPSSSTFTGIDISKDSGSVGSVTELKFTGNVDVSKTGNVGTINVKSSGMAAARTTTLGFPIFKESYYTGMVITDEPSIMGWGNSDSKTLGEDNVWPPVRCRFDDCYLLDNPNLTIKKVICGRYYAAALLSDGTLWLSGKRHSNGMTGLVATDNKPTFGFEKIDTNIKFDDFDLAVENDQGFVDFAGIEKDTRKLYVWGRNNGGSLGLGNDKVVTTPTLVSLTNTKKVRDVRLGVASDSGCKMLVLFEDDTLYSTGFNKEGQLGIGTTTNISVLTQCKKNSTTLVKDVREIVGVGRANAKNSAYISKSGELFVCGYNSQYNLGDGTKNDSSFFIKVNIPEKVKQVVGSGGNDTGTGYLALTESGKMYSWGYNGYGQLGHGDTKVVESPKLINSMKSINVQKLFSPDVFGGAYSFGCIDSNGRVYMVGHNVPSEENRFAFAKSTKFFRISVPKVKDMVILGNTKDAVGAMFLTVDGKLYAFSKREGYFTGATNTDTINPAEYIF